LSERRKALEASGLCMFCLKHPADSECFDQGGRMKPVCVQPECEEWYINVVRVKQGEDDWQELYDSWLEVDGGESGEEAESYCPSACLRKDDSGLEEELGYFHDVTPPPEEGGAEEDRFWSPEPQRPESEEENNEENQYLARLLMGEPERKNNDAEPARPQAEAAVVLSGEGHQTPEGEPGEDNRGPPRGEPEGEYMRFKESGRWIANMTGNRGKGQCDSDAGEASKG
jgi:hypothetical protein